MSLGSPVLQSGMTLVSRRPSPSLVKIPGIYGPIPILLDVTLEIYRPGSYQLGMTLGYYTPKSHHLSVKA